MCFFVDFVALQDRGGDSERMLSGFSAVMFTGLMSRAPKDLKAAHYRSWLPYSLTRGQAYDYTHLTIIFLLLL